MSHRVERLRKVQCIDYYVGVGFQEMCDGVEKMDEGCSGGGSGLKGELIRKIETRWWRTEGRVYVVSDYNAFKDSGEDWCYGNRSEISW